MPAGPARAKCPEASVKTVVPLSAAVTAAPGSGPPSRVPRTVPVTVAGAGARAIVPTSKLAPAGKVKGSELAGRKPSAEARRL